MKLDLAGSWARVRAFLRQELWNVQPDPRSWAARGISLLQFAVMTAEGFVRDQLLLRASALTYFTVLSIVPVLAIVGSVVAAVGVTEDVVEAFVQQVIDSPENGIFGETFQCTVVGVASQSLALDRLGLTAPQSLCNQLAAHRLLQRVHEIHNRCPLG